MKSPVSAEKTSSDDVTHLVLQHEQLNHDSQLVVHSKILY